MFKKILSLTVIFCFFLTTLGPLPCAHGSTTLTTGAESVLGLPAPGTMVNLSPAYQPVIIKGLTVHKDNPFLFDFIVDVGQDRMSGDPLKKEGEKLIKYFLASLAIPDKDLWVNLSPYEKNRMIPEVLGQTDMGRDLLEEDYILKQITASLIYPEKQLGKTFWDKVYAKAQAMYGTTQVPVNTFNKVWIMADKAEVFEHNQTAFVVDCHLKVMLEEDYLALNKHSVIPAKAGIHSLGSQIVRQIILPQLEREVNTGKNFANLRQIFNSVILSSWYKKNLKTALLNQVYANKSKVKGINLNDPTVKQQIYEQYLKAYKKGVFNYIKEDVNAANGETMPRKYFSGGLSIEGTPAVDPTDITDLAMGTAKMRQEYWNGEVDFAVLASTQKINSDTAMMTPQPIARPLTYQQVVAVNAIISQPKKYENLFRQPFSYKYSSEPEKIVAVLLRNISRRYRLVKPGVSADLSEIPLARVVTWTATVWKFLLEEHDFKIIDDSGTPVAGGPLLPGEIYSVRWVLENEHKGHAQDQLEANRIFENSQDQDVVGARTMVQKIEEIVQAHRRQYIVRLTEDFRDMLELNHLNSIQQRVAESAFGKRMEDYLNEPIPNSVNVQAWDMLKRNELPFIEYERPDRRMLLVRSQVQFGFTKPERIIVNAVIFDAAMMTPEDIKRRIKFTGLFPPDEVTLTSAALVVQHYLNNRYSPPTAAVELLVEKAGITKSRSPLEKENVRKRVKAMLDEFSKEMMKTDAAMGAGMGTASGLAAVMLLLRLSLNPQDTEVWQVPNTVTWGLPKHMEMPAQEKSKDVPKTHSLRLEQWGPITTYGGNQAFVQVMVQEKTNVGNLMDFLKNKGIQYMLLILGNETYSMSGRDLHDNWDKVPIPQLTLVTIKFPIFKGYPYEPIIRAIINPAMLSTVDIGIPQRANSVSLAYRPGGIDLNTSGGMRWKVSKDGQGVEMNVDPAMVERIKREGIDSLSPVIFRITPVANIWSLVGLQAPA